MTKRPTYWKKKEVLFMHKSSGGLGIRHIKPLNSSLLGKQAWRLYSNPNLLASKMFRAKYGADPVSNGYAGKQLYRPSWAAKSMCGSIVCLKGGIRRSIGDDRSTDVHTYIWAGNSLVRMKPAASASSTKWVADLVGPNGLWDMVAIRGKFDRESAEKIFVCRTPIADSEDGFWWKEGKTGEFFSKSAYWSLIDTQES